MGINRIDHAAVKVDDLGAALDWYGDVLGLTVLERGEETAHLTCAGEHADLTLIAGGSGIATFAMGADDEEDLQRAEQALGAHGVAHERIADPDRPGTAAILRFELPTGHTMEIATADKGRVAGQTVYDWDGKSHTPTDVDHINLLGEAPPRELADFLTEVLGFRLSLCLQRDGEPFAVWLRATPTDHDVAYMRSHRPPDRLHHVAFVMIDSNHYQYLADRLVKTGNKFEFGPGRHAGAFTGEGIATNLFAYAFDPAGNRNEFSGDMKDYADDTPPLVQEAPEDVSKMMNSWAVNMPESFMTIGS